MRFNAFQCVSMRFNAFQCVSMRFNALLVSLLLFSTLGWSQDCGGGLDVKKLKQGNPKIYQEYLRIEKLTEEYKARMQSNPNARLIDENGVITIPVVFHILHRGEFVGTGTNISDARINDQIDVLNQCYSQMNDQSAIPTVFRNVAANPNFRFLLACTDPNGLGTNGILRKQTTETNFFSSTQNAQKSSTGGDDAWATERYLNIWVVPNNLFQSTTSDPLGGYAFQPAIISQSPELDGAVVRAGNVGLNTGIANRSEGRTVVHEVGHWLNLLHTFNENGLCINADGCDDTPVQANSTLSVACPITFPLLANDCSGTPNGVMYDNFMDYTDDRCGRRMFSQNQVTRMRAVFQVGGPRRGFIDNYFKLTKLFSDCSLGYYLVKTPFCEANNNITWSITGPSTISNYPSTFKTVYPQSGVNGTAILTASWNNFTTDISIPIGYGAESSSYTPNYPQSGYVPLTVNQVHPTKYNRYTYGQVSFTGATGQAQGWRFLTNSSSSTTISGGNGNSFWIRFAQAGAFATIRADIPTLCGTRTVDYSFTSNLGGGYQYALSPNPASNNITITALNVSVDPNARTTSEMPEYEVQIFTRYNQLMKKTKCPKGSKDITIDVSNLPSNQLYTVQFISSEDVQTKSFFKE
jgi:hypothetical protein